MRAQIAIVLAVASAGTLARAASLTGTVTWSEPQRFSPVIPRVDRDVCGVQAPVWRQQVKTDAQGRVAGAMVLVPGLKATADHTAADTKHVQVRLRNCQLVPRVQVVTQGAVLSFKSEDPVLHNVTLTAPSGEILHSATLVAAGQVTSGWALHEVGRYRVSSGSGHHWLNGHIWVLPAGRWTQSGAHGRFSLKDLPPGRQRIVAWHPDLGICERSVDLVGTGTVSAALRF